METTLRSLALIVSMTEMENTMAHPGAVGTVSGVMMNVLKLKQWTVEITMHSLAQDVLMARMHTMRAAVGAMVTAIGITMSASLTVVPQLTLLLQARQLQV